MMASQKLVNCCVAAIASRKYVSLLDNRAPCIWRFLLKPSRSMFFVKASSMQKKVS
jgi:hypothetical protein